MTILDPGHKYKLATLDGDVEVILTFVKREGPGYPGNVGHYPGTNIQDVVRALIDRVKYLDNQISHWTNWLLLIFLRLSLVCLEARAAWRHRRRIPWFTLRPERMPTCPHCGHIGCEGDEIAKRG